MCETKTPRVETTTLRACNVRGWADETCKPQLLTPLFDAEFSAKENKIVVPAIPSYEWMQMNGAIQNSGLLLIAVYCEMHKITTFHFFWPNQWTTLECKGWRRRVRVMFRMSQCVDKYDGQATGLLLLSNISFSSGDSWYNRKWSLEVAFPVISAIHQSPAAIDPYHFISNIKEDVINIMSALLRKLISARRQRTFSKAMIVANEKLQKLYNNRFNGLIHSSVHALEADHSIARLNKTVAMSDQTIATYVDTLLEAQRIINALKGKTTASELPQLRRKIEATLQTTKGFKFDNKGQLVETAP